MVEQIAPQLDCASRQACPFWLDENQCCSLYKEGLFLPGSEHIRLFCSCRHDNYSSCSHYAESAQFVNDGVIAGRNRPNKRRVKRFPARFIFHLVNPAFDEPSRPIDNTVQTVDISEVGLRFESRTPMQVGTRIEFSLWHENSTPLLHGTGQIKWCHALENAPLYHAGISFADEVIIKAIQTQLDLS